MKRQFVILGLLLTVILLAIFVYRAARQTPPVDDSANDQFCIQVITPARNKATGERREFPTPCDVPEGWEIER